jgi:hypothetical protein
MFLINMVGLPMVHLDRVSPLAHFQLRRCNFSLLKAVNKKE